MQNTKNHLGRDTGCPRWICSANATTCLPDSSLRSPPRRMFMTKLTQACMDLYAVWMSAILDAETTFDEHLAGFEPMLEHAEAAINAICGLLFSFEIRRISSLGFVATRHGHPNIRRRALQLLRRAREVENTRHTPTTIALANRIIVVEDSGCTTGACHEGPDSLELPLELNRLAGAKTKYEIGNRGQVEQILTFGRWQSRDNLWFVTRETTKI